MELITEPARVTWNRFATLPIGEHLVECNIDTVAHLKKIANQYNDQYAKSYGKTDHNSGWAVIITNRTTGIGCRIVIVKHIPLEYTEKPVGRPANPDSARSRILSGCHTALNTGRFTIEGIGDISYARQIISNFNANHVTALALRKNAYSGGYDIINRDMEIVQTAQIPESLSEFINGRTDPNYHMTQAEFDKLSNDLNAILDSARRYIDIASILGL